MTQPLMGTLAWGDRSGGRLSEDEKIALARNVASLRAEMVFDELRTRLGTLRPMSINLDMLAPPDTKLVRDADAFAREIYDEVLWAHCMRTYYFGALVAAFDGIKFDREVFYAAAICHDAGANQETSGSVASCCFAHSGGKATQARLLSDGHSTEISEQVGDAISAHMNLMVPLDAYSAESNLTAIGATCDIFGAYAHRIAPTTLAEIVDRWPREGLMETFGAFLASEHLRDSRTVALGEMGALDPAGPHPVEEILAHQEQQILSAEA